jgi:hypothetical protein
MGHVRVKFATQTRARNGQVQWIGCGTYFSTGRGEFRPGYGRVRATALPMAGQGCDGCQNPPNLRRSLQRLGESAVKDQYLVRGAFLAPDVLQNTNRLQIFVFANDEAGQVLLVARLDNLGKGASGAAVQNMNIALGLDETAGLL